MAKRRLNENSEPAAEKIDTQNAEAKIEIKPTALYDSSDLAAMLGSTRNSVAVRRHHGRLRIPVIRPGNRCHFLGADILQFLADERDLSGSTRPQTKRAKSPGRPPRRQRVAS